MINESYIVLIRNVFQKSYASCESLVYSGLGWGWGLGFDIVLEGAAANKFENGILLGRRLGKPILLSNLFIIKS